MYEDAIELMNSRSEDIQADQKTLDVLSTSSLSIPESWDKIVHIRNGAIRHAACCSFLGEAVGQGEVRQAGSIRVVYTTPDASLHIPCIRDDKQRLIVSLPSLKSLSSQPAPGGNRPSKKEEELEAYIFLLKNRGPIPDIVRMRDPEFRSTWSDTLCRLYYFFILHPSDVFQGKSGVEYWEALETVERIGRKEKEREAWTSWNAQRNIVACFKSNTYPRLLPFEFPIFIQTDEACIPADRLFSMSGC